MELRLSWAQAEEMPILLANQLLLQLVGDVVLVTVGQVAYPAVVGPEDPRGSELARRGELPVRPLVRVALTHTAAAAFAESFAKLAEQIKDATEEPAE